MPLARSTCYSASSCERARLIIPRGNAGRYRQRNLVGRDRHRANHRQRHFLARPHFTEEDRREEKASSD